MIRARLDSTNPANDSIFFIGIDDADESAMVNENGCIQTNAADVGLPRMEILIVRGKDSDDLIRKLNQMTDGPIGEA